MTEKTLNFVEPSDVNISGIWSMDSFLLLSDEPAITGSATIAYDDYWPQEGGVSGRLTRELTNPTYRDLWVAASELIKESGDENHVFIEDFGYDEDSDVWLLWTGS